MEYIKAALIGILQGLTEFLPVSSSAHLAIFQNIFKIEGIEDTIFLTVLLHFGTLAAVIIVYRAEVARLIVNFLSLIGKLLRGKAAWKNLDGGERFVILLIIAVIPLFAAVPLEEKIEAVTGSTKLIGALLLVNAGVIFLSDKIKDTYKTEKNAKKRNALFVGLAQIAALLPGISRSGTTITAGLLNGFDREFAVKFSFILSIPVILGANIFKAVDFARSGESFTTELAAVSAIGFAFALISGFAAIKLLKFIMKNKSFYIFSAYCTVIGLIAVIFG